MDLTGSDDEACISKAYAEKPRHSNTFHNVGNRIGIIRKKMAQNDCKSSAKQSTGISIFLYPELKIELNQFIIVDLTASDDESCVKKGFAEHSTTLKQTKYNIDIPFVGDSSRGIRASTGITSAGGSLDQKVGPIKRKAIQLD